GERGHRRRGSGVHTRHEVGHVHGRWCVDEGRRLQGRREAGVPLVSVSRRSLNEEGLWVEKDGKRICLYKPTELQKRFHQSTTPNCIMEGSRGGGKSTAMRFDAHMRCL